METGTQEIRISKPYASSIFHVDTIFLGDKFSPQSRDDTLRYERMIYGLGWRLADSECMDDRVIDTWRPGEEG